MRSTVGRDVIKTFMYGIVCVKPAIKAVPDVNMESDLKLDQLESFLGKLNSKGRPL